MIGFVNWPPFFVPKSYKRGQVTKPIILVKICYKLLYVIQLDHIIIILLAILCKITYSLASTYSDGWSSHYLLKTTIVCSIQYDNNLLPVYPSVKIDQT